MQVKDIQEKPTINKSYMTAIKSSKGQKHWSETFNEGTTYAITTVCIVVFPHDDLDGVVLPVSFAAGRGHRVSYTVPF